MRALYIESAQHTALKNLEAVRPGPGQVLIDIAYVGICGSDLHYYYHGANGDFVVREPLIPGHELSGRVAEDPTGRWEPGQPVTVHPARFGTAQPTYPHQRHLWPGGSYLGSAATWPHTQGAAAEQLVVEADMVHPLAEDLPLRRAVLAEPLAVAMHGVSQAPVRGARVLVSGAGPIGLLALVAARAAGAAEVDVSDVLSGPLSRAEHLGASRVIDVSAHAVADNAYDVVLECSGAPVAAAGALTAARPAGTVVQIGMVPAGTQPVNLSAIISKELTVRGSFRFNAELPAALELLATNTEVGAVITHEFPLEQPEEAFAAAQDSQTSGKVIFAL